MEFSRLKPIKRPRCLIPAAGIADQQSAIWFDIHSVEKPENLAKALPALLAICSLFRGNCAVNACGSLGKIKIKNSAINEWIAGHNIVRIALYCKRELSFFIFSSYERSECFIAE